MSGVCQAVCQARNSDLCVFLASLDDFGGSIEGTEIAQPVSGGSVVLDEKRPGRKSPWEIRYMARHFRVHMMQVLGASLGLSFGCGGAAREARMRQDLNSDYCGPRNPDDLLVGLQPASPVSALALRSLPYVDTNKPENMSDEDWKAEFLLAMQAAVEQMSVVETQGDCDEIEDCPNLPVPEKPGALSGLNTNPATYASYHLVAYAQKDATILYTKEEVLAFLGTIDTPEEARLVLALEGAELVCDGDSNFKRDGSDYLFYTESGNTCGGNIRGHIMRVHADGDVSEEASKIVERGDKNCVIGRLPHGLLAADGRANASELPEYLARCAYLEAASVAAFEDIARMLRHEAAPAALSEWALRAARQERRHAIFMRALTRRAGGQAGVPAVERTGTRSHFELAMENAREGLTREAFGALLAQYQALMAGDLRLRRIMVEIARDELGHAEFSLALHRYLMGWLGAAERAQVEKERRKAIDEFRQTLLADESPQLRRALGLPDRDTALCLFDALFRPDAVFQA